MQNGFFFSRRPLVRTVITAVLALLVLIILDADAFHQMSMQSAVPRRGEALRSSVPRSVPFVAPLPSPPTTTTDITSGLISQLAVMAIKRRLAGHTAVSCDVSNNLAADLLLRGRVGPVTIKGKGWRSGRGLTCRAIEASVEQCELDVARILVNQKLVLTTPAKGKAMVALNSEDFGNFITHHRMKPPGGTHSPIEFFREGSRVDASTGTVTFFSSYEGIRWKCRLGRGKSVKTRGIVRVHVSSTEEGTIQDQEVVSTKLANTLSRFFNELVLDLDGTLLSFRDMMVTDKGESPSVMLALNILVRKFPSAGINF
jgi:hypothetical protein